MAHSLVKKGVGNEDVSTAVEHEVMHGDLFKLSRKGTWQKRWFRLSDEHLSYYSSDKATTPKATINLKDCHGIEKLRKGEKYTFGLVRDNTEPYWLKATTGDEQISQTQMNKWVVELKKRMDIMPGGGRKKKTKRDSLVVTKERNKKNAGKAKETAPENMAVEIIDDTTFGAESQTNNLIQNSTVRSEGQKNAVELAAVTNAAKIIEPKVIAIAIDDNKGGIAGDNTGVSREDEEEAVEPKNKNGAFTCCKK
jgi:hypothetical protein